MLQTLKKRWFLISLLVLIVGGLTTGSRLSPDDVASLKEIIKPSVVTAVVLFLMSFSLDSGHLKASLSSPGPVVWASAVNYGFIPLMGMLLMKPQRSPDFSYGLMIAASVPCTMAAASVWTRRARGNDAVSLLVTVLTNGLCFLITPFWLNLATRTGVTLDVWAMVLRLVSAVLVPTLIGQSIRLFRPAAEFANKRKTPIGVAAQACILTIVFVAGCEAGNKLSGGNGSQVGASAPSWFGVFFVWGSCILLHLLAMGVGVAGGRLFRFRRVDNIAVVFASSQKTLPIGLLLATDEKMFGNPNLLGAGLGIPFAVFPMLMYHASQLFIDTVIADRIADRDRPEEDDVDTV